MSRAETGKLETLTPEERAEIEAVGAVLEPHLEADSGFVKIDLHCHTEASPDCVTPIELIPDRCREQGINIQAITDHNLIWGAEKLKQIVKESHNGADELTIVVGEEITTSQGELIGLFLEESIQAGMSPEETVEKIESQGGLVLLPHGFDPIKRWRLSPKARERIANSIDIVETFNARVSRRHWNHEAVIWSQEHDKLMSAGSDAHTIDDIGTAWVAVRPQTIDGPEDLLAALDGGVPVGKWTHPVIAFLFKLWYRLRQKLKLKDLYR